MTHQPLEPGRAVPSSASGRPIMVLLELLGRRWALRVIWELRDGPLGFRELQARAGGLSPTILSTRLDELRSAGLVEDSEGHAGLTRTGEQLLRALEPLAAWAERWAGRS